MSYDNNTNQIYNNSGGPGRHDHNHRRLLPLILAVLAGAMIVGAIVQPGVADASGRTSGHESLVTETTRPEPSTDGNLGPNPGPGSRPGPIGPVRNPPGLVDPGGPKAGLSADCFVDFENEAVLTYSIIDSAHDSVMRSPWYESCFDATIYPAMAIKPTVFGHLHLPYTDTRIGPCEWDLTHWGRKANHDPGVDDPGYVDWLLEPCTEEIDPTTEPRNGIKPHEPGEIVRVYLYDDDGKVPFAMKTLEVVEGDVEVCHLPPGPHKTIDPTGSPWQCLELGVGYWGLSNIIDNAIEVRINFLTYGEVNNIGLDIN